MGIGNLAKMAQQMQADMARVEDELRDAAARGQRRRRRRQGRGDRPAGAASR